uniref:Large ribosomal subunit protein uL16m n=1 Tax=Caligus clemensi TaxID=344056 RepID=C1C240_CALCM|nr:39S ribosomal protein L16, mitochondrial precursor [Caligus clemensi]
MSSSSLSGLLLRRGLRMSAPVDPILPLNMPAKHRLPVVPKIPSRFTMVKMPKAQTESFRMRGEELVHKDLILSQGGIMSLSGGFLKSNHFDMMRSSVGHNMGKKKAFAIYRVDAPHKPKTQLGVGKRKGGGKPSIHHYVTPIRAGRVILEVGGELSWEQMQPWLHSIAEKLPFKAIAVNPRILQNLKEEEERLQVENLNPVTFEWLIRNNIFDCQKQLSPYDKKLFGKFVYKDKTLNIKWKDILGKRTRYTY